MRTNSADRSGEGDLVFDKFYRGVVFAVSDKSHIALTVRMRRAVELTGGNAVAVVSGHKQLHSYLSRLHHTLALGVDDHALHNFSGA